jgi:hypothetical protein
VAGNGLQLLENGHRLTRKRHDVWGSHLHSLSRDSPLGFHKIELGPFGLAELAGPDEHEWREAERASGNERPLITINGVQKLAQRGGLCDASEMPMLSGSECTNQIA